MTTQIGATIMEIMVVVTLICIVLLAVFGTNYVTQMRKAGDTKKKSHLELLKKGLEDYHADHSVYPSLSIMGYELMDDVVGVSWDNDTNGAVKICGDQKFDPSLQEYFSQFPCNPESPGKDYVYFLVEGGQEYAIYTLLDNFADPAIEALGCQYGCSYFKNIDAPEQTVSGNMFNYYVSSSGYYQVQCDPASYSACWTGRPDLTKCKICPNGEGCEQTYQRLYCHASWCAEYCE